MITLKAGMQLFHGTDNDDFEEAEDRLNGPAWLSDSKAVAQYFATRSGGWGGTKRIITYTLAEDVKLHHIRSGREMLNFSEEHNIDTGGVEEMRESVEDAGIPGWVISSNYPEGDDILIVDTGVLDYVQTELCVKE